jgi:O-antigen/teichoic acid export membrane protein
MVNSAITAALGFVFWTVVARLYPPSQVGLAAAAVSSTLFLATLAHVGLPWAMVRLAPTSPAARASLTTAIVLMTTVIAAAAGATFVAGLTIWASPLTQLAEGPVLWLAMVITTAATAAAPILSIVAVAARDTLPALVGGFAQGITKIVAVALMAFAYPRSGLTILAAWTLGMALAVLVLGWLLRRQLTTRVGLGTVRLGELVRYSAANYAADLAWTSTTLLLPLAVVSLAGAETNAYFYIAWGVSSLLVTIPSAAASSLLAEGSHSGETGKHLASALRLSFTLLLPAVALTWVATPWVLGIFGASYAINAADTLRVLALAALPVGVNVLFLTAARVDRNMSVVWVIALGTSAASVGLAYWLVPSQGSVGAAFGYLAAHAVVALVLLVSPFGWRTPVHARRA